MTTLSNIIKDLESIRKRVGGRLEAFPFDQIRINNDLTSRSEVEALFHSSGFLMARGAPVFVYIRDHTVVGYPSPKEANKIHFFTCRTLQSMVRKERFQRYHVTNRDDNRYLIDTRSWRGKEVELYPCQNCLESVSYRCFHWHMAPSEKEKIIRDFDAKAAFALIGQQFEIFKQKVAKLGLLSASLPAGYSFYWPRDSKEIRKSKNYTCEKCGVHLQHVKGCLDVHHKDHNKQNIKDSNLICLCKCCHAEQHEHYHVSDYCKRHIEQARKKM